MILAIYCAGGMGRKVLDLARSVNRWEDILFVDDVTEETICHGAAVYRFPDVEQFRGRVEFVIANGEPSARAVLYDRVKAAGYPLATLAGTRCDVSSSACLGEGVVLFNCYLCPDVRIGDNVMIVSRVDVGHDTVIGSHSFINSMTFIGGYAHIGERVYIAPGALLRDRIAVGDDAIIGMGAVVVRDVAAEAVVVGNPAKEIGRNMERKVFKTDHRNGGGVTAPYRSFFVRRNGSRQVNAWMNAAICLLCAA